jgi:muramoyltetrapeptide carboxypeptidase LdcA involved in peptidoglycan recycling
MFGESLRKPEHLRAGDRVAAVTLSWGGPGQIPTRYMAGKRQLEATFGLHVVEMTHTVAGPEYISRHPEARAEDLMSAFSDPSINGIVSTIGGDDAIRILPYLDLDVIRDNPKVFVGYSDTTIVHMACMRAGIVSFYGPSIMSGFAENGGIMPYMEEGVTRTIFSPDPPGLWPENRNGWTVEHLDWADSDNQDRPRRLTPSSERRWLQGDKAVEGPTVAGCVEVLDWLRGTDWWPRLNGSILAIETSEEAPPPEIVARFLRSVAEMGELKNVRGLLVGRPGGSDLPVEQHARYDEAIMRVVREEQGLSEMPIVSGMDFGHTDPMWTIPEGVRVRVDPEAEVIEFMESGCK